jgi:hypothetical protein
MVVYDMLNNKFTI